MDMQRGRATARYHGLRCGRNREDVGDVCYSFSVSLVFQGEVLHLVTPRPGGNAHHYPRYAWSNIVSTDKISSCLLPSRFVCIITYHISHLSPKSVFSSLFSMTLCMNESD